MKTSQEGGGVSPIRGPGEVRLEGFTDQVRLTDAQGVTRSFFIIVNSKGGAPVEVFMHAGKSGGEVGADTEAMGKLTSIALQYGVPKEVIINTLRGINGGLRGTYQGQAVSSSADLVALALG